MNELIFELWKKFINNELLFAGVVQAACKAQRNACARVYINPPKTDEISDCSMSSAFKKIQNNIQTAQIERQDYE